MRILDRLKAHGALPWSATEPDVDLSTPNGLWYVHTKLHFQVAPERRTIAIRTSAARRDYTEHGRPYASVTPRYGYRWITEGVTVVKRSGVLVPLKEKLEADPITAPVVVRIFEWAIAGKTLEWIAKVLTGTEEGGRYKTPTPRTYRGVSGANEHGEWSDASVYEILTFHGYMGRWPAYRTKRVPRNDGSEKSKQVPVPEEEWVWVEPSPAPPLVSREQWLQVQKILANNKRYSARNRQHPITAAEALLYSGMARCGLCGKRMAVVPRAHQFDRPDG